MKKIENIEKLESINGGSWWNPSALECFFALPIGAFEVMGGPAGVGTAGGRVVNCWNS
jgi:hypothetical protein